MNESSIDSTAFFIGASSVDEIMRLFDKMPVPEKKKSQLQFSLPTVVSTHVLEKVSTTSSWEQFQHTHRTDGQPYNDVLLECQ